MHFNPSVLSSSSNACGSWLRYHRVIIGSVSLHSLLPGPIERPINALSRLRVLGGPWPPTLLALDCGGGGCLRQIFGIGNHPGQSSDQDRRDSRTNDSRLNGESPDSDQDSVPQSFIDIGMSYRVHTYALSDAYRLPQIRHLRFSAQPVQRGY